MCVACTGGEHVVVLWCSSLTRACSAVVVWRGGAQVVKRICRQLTRVGQGSGVHGELCSACTGGGLRNVVPW